MLQVHRPHVVDSEGNVDEVARLSSCVLVIPARRNFLMFVVKQVFMSIAIVYAGLLSLYMAIADHTGDRAALIGVSLLIVIINFQTPLIIGEVQYLVWWDIFNLFAFGVRGGLLAPHAQSLLYMPLVTHTRGAQCIPTSKQHRHPPSYVCTCDTRLRLGALYRCLAWRSSSH